MIGSRQRSLPDNIHHNRQTCMPTVGFETAISSVQRAQTGRPLRSASLPVWDLKRVNTAECEWQLRVRKLRTESGRCQLPYNWCTVRTQPIFYISGAQIRHVGQATKFCTWFPIFVGSQCVTCLNTSGLLVGGGGLGGFNPPEIPKFWQSRTGLLIERKMFSFSIPKS